MTVADLKLKIFRQVDALEKSRLEELYGILNNFLNREKDIDDWINLTDEQRQGLLDSIEEIDSGIGIPHNKVIAAFRKKFSND